MKIIPSQDYVVIHPIEKQELQTESGVIVPKGAMEESNNVLYARVIAVGPGKVTSDGVRVELPYKPGDYIAMMVGVPVCVVEQHQLITTRGKAKAKTAIVSAQYILAKIEVEEGETVRFTDPR